MPRPSTSDVRSCLERVRFSGGWWRARLFLHPSTESADPWPCPRLWDHCQYVRSLLWCSCPSCWCGRPLPGCRQSFLIGVNDPPGTMTTLDRRQRTTPRLERRGNERTVTPDPTSVPERSLEDRRNRPGSVADDPVRRREIERLQAHYRTNPFPCRMRVMPETEPATSVQASAPGMAGVRSAGGRHGGRGSAGEAG